MIKSFYIILFLSINIYSQITDITRLSSQDPGQIYWESSPVAVSENEIIIFFLSRNSSTYGGIIDTLYSSRSTDRGKSWQEKKFIIEVLRTDNQQKSSLSALRTNSGRILVAFIDSKKDSTCLIYSDDKGSTWSDPEFFDGHGFKMSRVFNKIVISWSYYYRESYDDGKTWSYEISNIGIEPCSFVSLEGNLILGFFFEYEEEIRGIYEKVSTDGGQSWSEPVKLLPFGMINISYSVIKISAAELWLVYENQVAPWSPGYIDLFYIKSTDGGVTWSSPSRITSYVGIDDYVNGVTLGEKPFITFASTRFTNKPQISYSVLGETIEDFRPPFITHCQTLPDSTSKNAWILNCRVIDDQKVIKVTATPEFGDEVILFDDGEHNDGDSADNNFGNIINPDYLPPADNCYMDVNKIHMPLGNTGVIAEVQNSFDLETVIMAEDNEQQIIADKEILKLDYVYREPQYDESSFLFSGGFYLSGYTNGELWTNGVVSVVLLRDYIPGKYGTTGNNSINKIYVVNADEVPFGYSWQEWRKAAALGAEFYDGDDDGIYNPVDKNWNGTWDKNEDMPLLIGNETAWCLYNDGLPAKQRRWPVEPQGIEIRQTVFASDIPGLESTMFIRYSILNTGAVSNTLDSVYFGTAKDPDLGDFMHNLVGCDTLLNSDFVYNTGYDEYYGNNSPSFFTTILQGPLVASAPGDTAYINSGMMYGSEQFPGFKNLGMISHVLDYDWVPFTPVSIRYNLIGKDGTGNYLDPCTLPISEVHGGINCSEINPVFWMSGDPVTDVGWILTLQSDQRNLTGIGPFQLIKDEPQEIIIAYVLGRGTDPINSITAARENVRKTIQEYKSNFASMTYTAPPPVPISDYKLYQNYPNPFNPVTRIRFELLQDGIVTIEIFDIIGQKVTRLMNEFRKADRYEVEFDGSGLASGVYIYRIKVNDFISSKKMVLIR